MSEEDIALIAKSEVPPGNEHLDDELKDETAQAAVQVNPAESGDRDDR